eukprot:2577657-Alexandrium_andersonii.AAC.1
MKPLFVAQVPGGVEKLAKLRNLSARPPDQVHFAGPPTPPSRQAYLCTPRGVDGGNGLGKLSHLEAGLDERPLRVR